MPLNESVYRRKQREGEEKKKREQAVEIARGSQNGTNNNTTNPSTSSQNSTQTSQRGSQSPSSVDKLFESTARKYTNSTANDSIRRNSRGQEVSGRERTRSAVNSPNASSSRAKEDTGKWARSEAYGALTGFNKELASAADFLLPDVITPKKVQNVLDYYRKADEEQQQKVQELRGDSKLREIAGTIGGETLKNIPSAAMAMLSGGTSVGAQVAGEAVPSLLEGARLAKTGNVVSRAMDEVARTSGQNPMFWETFLRTVGPTYDNEIANGADPVRATMSAYANALLNAQIEIGGGIEKYDPSEVFWKAALRSAKEEGMEEVQQYAVENLVNKAIGSNRTKDKNGNTIETPWFSMDRGVNAVINPVDMAEQGFYGAAAGGLMSGGRTLGVNAVNDARNNNYRQEHPDFEEHAKDLIQRASVQGREGEMSTRAQNLAEEVSEQMAKGKTPTAYQMRELESAVATDEYYNQQNYENSSQERYNQAVEEGKADTVKQTGTADEYYGFRRGLNETEQRNYDKAKAVMGENASENSVVAVSKLMTGSESNRDIDTILLDPEARSAVEELAEVTLPINNVKARAELENIALVNQIANRDKILEQTHKDIRTNMSRRGGELFDDNYDEAVKTLDVPNAAEIYENFFSRFYTAGTVEDADFEKTYNRIISPLVEDFGEDFGSRISQVFTHDFAQKVFAQGQIAMNSVRAKAQGRSLSVKASENPAGFTYEEEARKHISDREADLFTKLAERAKVHIRLVSSIAGGQANGSYDPETGVILIAADSDNKFITVFKHELTHHLKNTSPELYQKLEDFVFKKWYDGDPEKMEERVQEYQRRYGMRPEEAREEIIADASEAFFTDEGAINEAVTFNEKMARAIHDGIKSLLDTFLDLVDTDRRADKGYGDFLKDLDILRDAEKMWLEALNDSVGKQKGSIGNKADLDAFLKENGSAESGTFIDSSTGENVQFSLRTEAPPKKTRKGYKVFVVKNGELYPPMVANPNGEPTPVGVWLNADEGVRAGTSKTGRPQVKAGGKGTQGGSGTLAYRPGWHLGEMPLAQQFARKDSQGNKTLFPSNFVWAECDIAADNDYQEEAMSYGYTESGKFRHAYAGLPRIPKDGFYQYRTNPDPNTVPWLITGAMKINRILSDAEVRDILAEKGFEAPKRQGGDKTLEELGIKNVKLSLKDSDGNTLSEGQAEYFKDSKVRDKDGNLLKVYHGTYNDFTVFKANEFVGEENGLSRIKGYFSTSEDYSRVYGHTQSYYLNIKNPLFIPDEWKKLDEWRTWFAEHGIKDVAFDSGIEEDGIKGYGYEDGTKGYALWDLFDTGDYWYGDGNLTEKIEDAGYDGIYWNEGEGWNVGNGKFVEGNPLAYMPFNENAIKRTDNLNPTEHEDIRFSMKEPVEETKDLLAVHNLKAEDLRGALDLGGFPMPSIAIIKAAAGHNAYGEYSAIFDKSTIDPSVTKKNEVYGGDAWTPTFPSIRYKANEKVRKKISDIYYKNVDKLGYDAMRPLQRIANEPNDALDSAGGEAKLKEAYKQNTDMMRMFLRINGKDVKDVINRTEDTLSDVEVTIRQHFIDALGEDAIREFEGKKIPNGPEKAKHRIEWVKSHKADVENAYADFMKKEWGFTDEEAQDVLKDMKLIEHMNFIRDAMNYLNNGKTTIRESVDSEATKQAIKEKAKNEGYDKWVDDLLAGIEEKKGIRNNKDPFTNSGSRRSWEALHDEPTLLNIVRVMSAQDNGETFLGSSLKAVAQKRYKNISEVRADKGRLKTISEEEYKTLMDSFAERENDIITRIDNASPTYESNPFIRHSDIRSSIVDNVRRGLSKAAFLKDLQQYANTKGATAKDVDDIFDLVRDVANIPTGYFEAKPKRPVTFGEVRALLAPSDAPAELIEKLKDEGVNVVQYEAENEEDRIAKLNEAAEERNLKFSLKSKQNPNQLDFFDMLKGMGVDEGNAKIGAEALADTGKLKDKSKGKKKGSPYNTLAVSFYKEMIQDGSATLVGHKFKNKHDLAQALQMYRDPRYETCRLFFLDKNNKIVMQTGITQRLPSQSAIFAGTTNEERSRYINSLLHSATKRGAVAFYTSHNHPSGDPTPSRDDYGVNAIFKDLANQSRGALKYRGQIVIDHNTYSYMSPGKTPSNFGEGADIYSIYSAKKIDDPLHKSDDESKRMGMNQALRNYDDIAGLLMSLNVPEDHATLLYLSAQLRGKAIQSMEISHFGESDSYHIKNEITENAKAFGAHSVVLGMNEPKDSRTRLILDELYENGSLLDVFTFDNNHGYSNYASDESKDRGWGDLWSDLTGEAPEQVGEEIKYSLKSGGESRNYQNTISKLENQVKDLKSEFKRTNLKTADQKQVRIQAGKLITRHGSNMQAQKSLIDTFNEIFRLYKENGTDAFDEVYEIAKNEAVNIVNNISVVHNEGEETYKAIKDYLRNTPITISEDMKRNITDFNDFRKRYFGKLKITNGNTTNIDNVYMELMELFPEQFTEDYVNPADQLYHMADVLDNYAPYYETLDGASPEMQDYVVDIAADIMETAYGLQTKKTFADKKYEEKVRAVEKAREKALASRDKELGRLRRKYDEVREALWKANEKTAAERLRGEMDTQRAKQRLQDYKAETRERGEKKRRIQQIADIHKRLSDMLFKANDTKHLPDGYADTVARVLSLFDFTTKGMERWAEKNGKLSNRYKALKDLKDKLEQIGELEKNGIPSSIEFDERLVGGVRYLYDAFSDDLTNGNDRRLEDMTSEELTHIKRLFEAFEYQVKMENKAFDEENKRTRSEMAHSIFDDLNETKRGKWRLGVMGRLFTSNFNPSDFFTLVGGDIETLYNSTRKGFDKYVERLSDAKDFIQDNVSNKKADKWANHVKTYKASSGEEIELTDSMLMSLYCLSKREQAQGHIYGGGIASAPTRVKKKMTTRELEKKRVIPSYQDLQRWFSDLTDEQIQVAEQIQKYFVDEVSEWGNETSLKLFNYRKFNEPNYFPIQSSKDYMASNFDERGTDPVLKNIGPSHQTVEGANNVIMVDDIFTVFSKHVAQMAAYNAYVPAITDFQRVWNYTEGNDQDMVKARFADVYGQKAADYIDNFFKNLNGVYKRNFDVGLFDKGLGLFKKSAVGGNVRVLVQQPTAIARAALIINPVYLTAALPTTTAHPKRTFKEMMDHCSIAKWKTWGFYSSDITSASRDLRNIMIGKEALTDKVFMDMYGVADNMTWTVIFKACELQVEAQNKGIKKGSDEYWEKVSALATRVFDRTQVVDSPFHRSEIMKSQDKGIKMVTAFMAEPTKTINMLNTELTMAARELANGHPARATGVFVRVATVITANSALLAVAQALVDAARGAGGDDDKDKGNYVERLINYWKDNFWDNMNPFAMIPYIKDVKSLWDGYDVARMDMNGVKKAIQAIQYLQKYYEDPANSKYTEAEEWKNLALTAFYAAGIPIQNAKRDLEAIYLTAMEATGHSEVFFEQAKRKYQVNDKTRSIFADMYYDALDRRDYRTADKIYSFLLRNGVTEEYIDGREKTWRKHKDEDDEG